MPGSRKQQRATERRSEPIDKRTARNGAVTYTFQVDVGTRPDGRRDRQRFTYRTLAEARREYRRITTEVAQGQYVRLSDLTVDQACDQWLEGRRGIRRITLEGYTNDLKPVRRRFGSRKVRDLTKADGDDLVSWMLTSGRVDPRHFRPDSLMSRVADYISQHSEGVSSAELKAAFPDNDVHTCVAGLVRAGRVVRPRRGFYCTAPTQTVTSRGVRPVTVRSTLTTFTMMIQSYVDQGSLPRNVIALVERPSDEITDEDDQPTKSWTTDEVLQFREAVRGDRLYACWLMSCYGLRRSEVMGMRWSRFGDDLLRVRRGRVAIGKETEEGLPKSRRSRRELPPPADLAEALITLKRRQKAEALALGIPWDNDNFIAVHEDGEPVRPEWYSDEFQRIIKRVGLRRIPLKGLRNSSVSHMLASGIPVHIVAAWHGHDPAVSLSIYSHAQIEDLRRASNALLP
ncbi:site-specific integrase [Nocardia nova]|uniref:Site-specific integrase n=1 Tax=Nocardia nova TaxID=37330 RepID=A0A2S6A061_9NOCA|nr:site-specific integrase [Nocardia nova]PPI89111.1 site-specific integrase [Nocardia nova]PPJ24341.1 site-specific integrase [Nocardia nova]